MRICHITTVHPAKDARIFYRMSRALAERGLSVTLVASEPFEDPLVKASEHNSGIGKSQKRVKRIQLALQAALREKADVYHFHDPELIVLGLALKALRPSSAIVYDVHEDYPSQMLVKYWIPRPARALVAWAARASNTAAALCLDGIVTADPEVEKDFQRFARKKTLVYYNFPTLSLFSQDSAEIPQVKTDLVYIGGMSGRAGMFVLFDALALLGEQGMKPTARLAGYTDGVEGLAAIREGIRTRGLMEQVEVRGRLPYSQVPSWIRSGRIGLVALQPIAKFLKNIPTKMFEYWACGLPVIASDLPPIRPFLSDKKNGLLFDPSSPGDLARAIRWCVERPEEFEAMGQYGQQLVFSSWNNDRQIDGLINFYEQVCRR